MQPTMKGLPAKITASDARLDQFSDSGSDNQNKFEMKVPAVADLLKEFEQGDETMKKLREHPPGYKTEYAAELQKLNANIR